MKSFIKDFLSEHGSAALLFAGICAFLACVSVLSLVDSYVSIKKTEILVESLQAIEAGDGVKVTIDGNLLDRLGVGK